MVITMNVHPIVFRVFLRREIFVASLSKMDAGAAFSRIKPAFSALADTNLKSQQLLVLDSLLSRHHTVAILPTGYGKTLIFAIFPLLMDEVKFVFFPSSQNRILLTQNQMCLTQVFNFNSSYCKCYSYRLMYVL